MYRRHPLSLKSQIILVCKCLEEVIPNHYITVFHNPRLPRHIHTVMIYGVRYQERKKLQQKAIQAMANIYAFIGKTRHQYVPAYESYKETKKWHPEYLEDPT